MSVPSPLALRLRRVCVLPFFPACAAALNSDSGTEVGAYDHLARRLYVFDYARRHGAPATDQEQAVADRARILLAVMTQKQRTRPLAPQLEAFRTAYHRHADGEGAAARLDAINQ